MHCDCPWGGELLRLRVEVQAMMWCGRWGAAQVENVPENRAQLLVRPEVRALFGNGNFQLDVARRLGV